SSRSAKSDLLSALTSARAHASTISVEAPCPDSDLPFTRAWSDTCPRLSRPGVTDWTTRFPTSIGCPTISLTAANVAAIGPSPLASAARSPAHGPGSHDFVREAVLHHAVLMDAGFVGERVAPHDRLVGLREHARHVGQQPAGAIQLARLDVTPERGHLRPDVARHHDLLERGV